MIPNNKLENQTETLACKCCLHNMANNTYDRLIQIATENNMINSEKGNALFL